MALILKQGETYEFKGINIPNPYLVIDYCNGSKNPNSKQQLFTVHIYTNQSDRANNERIIFAKDYVVMGEDWQTYFSPAAISEDSDQYARAYDYIKSLKDENDVFVYNKWEDLV